MKSAPPILRERARSLRREQTEAERKLWQRLRGGLLHGVKFRRQHPIGPFIADFCCLERGVIVEIDGAQHAERAEQDRERSAFLEAAGYCVLRFWNNEVLRHEGRVLEAIAQLLTSREGWRWGSGRKKGSH